MEVEIHSQEKATNVEHWFDLVAPALGGFRERILTATHAKNRVYPVGLKASCFNLPSQEKWAMSQEEFIELVREVLRSDDVRSSIQSLLARSNEAKIPFGANEVVAEIPHPSPL